jgi:threonine dehydrogenase-like Zn-dependent dehydrogenase
MACRKGGTLSIAGVYGGLVDKIPIGALMNKALTVKTGQTHVQRYMQPLLARIQKGEVDPTFIITHRLPLSEAPKAFEIFSKKQDSCIKVVLKP